MAKRTSDNVTDTHAATSNSLNPDGIDAASVTPDQAQKANKRPDEPTYDMAALISAGRERFPDVTPIVFPGIGPADLTELLSIPADKVNDARAKLATLYGGALQNLAGLAIGGDVAAALALRVVGVLMAEGMKQQRSGLTADDRKAGAFHCHRLTQSRAFRDMARSLPRVRDLLEFVAAAPTVAPDKHTRTATARKGHAVGAVIDAVTGSAPKGVSATLAAIATDAGA